MTAVRAIVLSQKAFKTCLWLSIRHCLACVSGRPSMHDDNARVQLWEQMNRVSTWLETCSVRVRGVKVHMHSVPSISSS